MIFKLACLYLAVTCIFAAPPTDVVPLEKQQPTVIPIVSQSEELEANGTYKFSYETANGIKREETSYDKVLPKSKSAKSSDEAGEDSDESNEIHVQQGSYSYTAPDGTVISVRYIADENGFRPIGDHLPKPPSEAPSSSGRRAKTLDSAGSGSAPASAASPPEPPKARKALEAPKTPEPPQTPEAPKSPASDSPAIESRLGDTSAEQPSTTEATEAKDSSTTEAPASESSTTEVVSTTEQASAEVTTAATSEPTTEAKEESSTPSEQTTPQELTTPAAESSTSQESSTPTAEPSTQESSTIEE